MDYFRGNNIKDLCRACLHTVTERKSLLSNSLEVFNIREMYMSVTNVVMEVTEATPKHFCKECQDKLTISFNFKKQCLESEDIIKNHLSQEIKIEAEGKTCNEEVLGGSQVANDSLDFVEEKHETAAPKSRRSKKEFTLAEVLGVIDEIQKNQSDIKKCIVCPEINTFSGSVRSLILHMAKAHSNISNWCSTCNEIIDENFEDFEDHKNEHDRTEGQCKFCNKRVRRRSMIEHLKTHTGVNDALLVCDVCQKSFSSKWYLKVHLKRHGKRLTEKLKRQKSASMAENNESLLSDVNCVNEEYDYKDLAVNLFIKGGSSVHESSDNSTSVVNNSREEKEISNSSDTLQWKVEREMEMFKERENNIEACRICLLEMGSDNLRDHMTEQHSHITNWCSLCNALIDEDFEGHTNSHAKEHVICRICKVGVKKIELVEHLKTHVDNLSFCLITNEEEHLQQQDELKDQEKEKVAVTSLKNQLNDQILDEDTSFEIDDKHNFISLEENLRPFTTKTSQQSKKQAKGSKKFRCNICGKVFSRQRTLRKHIDMAHINEGDFRCSFCRRLCPSRPQLIEHERVHTGEKPHICNTCGKGFAQKSSLATHMRIHGEKRIACTLCDKRFNRTFELRVHMMNHTGERQYLCTECGKGFTQKSHLDSHLKIHSDETPFKCNQCGKGFKRNDSLKFHLLAHSGYKSLKCPHCTYACNKKYHLKQHMKRHSDALTEEQFLCQICGNSFTTKGSLQMHMTSVHNAIL